MPSQLLAVLEVIQQVEPPQSLVALMWVVVTALASSSVFMFRQLLLMHDKYVKLIEAQYAASKETSGALEDINKTISSMERALDLEAQLREAIRERRAKDANAY